MADTIAEKPMPDFISSPGLFVKEQKPRPVGGLRGAIFNMTGGAWNMGPGAKQRQEEALGRRISRQLQGSYNTAVLSLKGGIGKIHHRGRGTDASGVPRRRALRH